MGKRAINGSDFAGMALLGADLLKRNAEQVNALNVFPVPDGDTGTNMNLTMTSGITELKNKQSAHLGKTAEALSKGLLMGARGNSGVILSQLFRGFSKSLANVEEATAVDIAVALQHGVDMAYKAVVKPVEGTILTVAKEAARHAVQFARRNTEVLELMQEVHNRAYEALQKTPDLLPILKQVGVVDSGGQGLVYIYEGFVQSLSGNSEILDDLTSEAAPADVYVPQPIRNTAPISAQAKLETLDIEFFYDMEFFIKRNVSGTSLPAFDESAYKKALSKDGDSILVITEDDIIKVHVHSRKPGDVFNLSVPYGELTDMHILNMREQHRELLEEDIHQSHVNLSAAELLAGQAIDNRPTEQAFERAPYGMITVALGDGVAELFRSSDVDIVLSGGQTMNPSTEDFVKAIEALSADHIFIFPNNSNIILAAEQAVELTERSVTVIPTKTIPQGIAAVLAFKEDETPERNKEWMNAATSSVVSGQITKAVRDTSIDGVEITEGHYIGIKEKSIVTSEAELLDACKALLTSMLEEEGDIVTILTGEGSTDEISASISEWIGEHYSDLEIEVQYGGQPLYPYVFAVE
ncbi:MAG: DAK2 domain-containing protein [Candidatus Pristimantibacillus lignocellulolyticus]|uniref:DAK2 domain-containing protein n=1 Tax=Candidatus Pristimantibacillus lignocellulolyticus TaxID=2994561 RepID=A0A9J6ZB59_9BACL|nr:MAG: DAK2 domain-containing protein [Candidatus Pristimantibacillus lignocellulolyticus]